MIKRTEEKILELQSMFVPDNIIEKCPKEYLDKLLLWCQASKAYYDTNPDEEPIMSDTEFDDLQEELCLITEIAPFIKSSIFRNSGLSVAHYTQEMISLFKIKWQSRASVSEINKFFRESGINFAALLKYAPKFDGCSLKITWEHTPNFSRIVQIITRGGIDVTHLFSKHPDILATEQYKTQIVCGELLCGKLIFAEKYSSEVGGDYENPRNFVGGLVKKSEISANILSDLSFIPCTDGINTLGKNYDGSDLWTVCSPERLYSLEELVASYKSDTFPFLCDGVVIAFDESNHQRRVKDNYPLNMVAVKFPSPKACALVVGFDWTQKKSGKLTPRLILEPTKLDGTTVSAANGYNIGRIIENGIGIGSLVEISKSGDIIPIVVRVVKKSTNIQYPDCEYKRVGKHLMAVDKEKSRVFKFVAALRLLQLQGIGDTLAQQIGAVVDYDVFELFNTKYKPEISKVLGGGANWNKFADIYNIRSLHLDETINLLQFDNVGSKSSKKIAGLILKTSSDTSNLSSDIICNVCRGEGFKQILEAVAQLKTYGIATIKPIEINEDSITYEMSGNPVGMTKQQFEVKLKEQFPNAIHTSITKDTKILFVDTLTSNTSKALKARKYNIKMVQYQDALDGKI